MIRRPPRSTLDRSSAASDVYKRQVIVVDAGEVEAERGIARQRPGRVARQQIDLARLERGEALLRRGRHDLELAGVAEDGGGDGSAEIDVEARPFALAVSAGEAGHAG